MHPFVNLATKAARKAGSIIIRHMDQLDRVEVTAKGRNDFVSSVDKLAEEEIIYTIKQSYPDHAILGEESGRSGEHDYEWIIDPLDGTTNYLHGYPQFAVSIAVARKGVVEHGVIFDPLSNELFTATRGQGARMNDARLRVSNASNLQTALIGTGFPINNFEHIDQYLAGLKSVISGCHGVRRAGSASLDLAHVAAGRLDGYWESGLKPWDVAAGCLLILEAGGMVSDFKGNNQFWKTGEVIAANPKVFIGLTRALRPHFN